MSKRVIIGLAIVMAFILLGLIFVQFKWIKIAFTVNEEQFDQIVRRALTDAARNLEHDIRINTFFDDLLLQSYDTLSAVNKSVGKNNDSVQLYPDMQASFSLRSNINGRIIDTNISISIVPKSGKNAKQRISINNEYYNNQIRKQELIQQMLQGNLYSISQIENNIDNQMLVEAIEYSLDNYGIDLDFEYALTSRNLLSSYSSKNFNPTSQERIYRVKLFSDNFYNSNNYISIYFPKRKKYIYNQLGFIGGISSVLILVIIGTFAFTLYVIFRQKKLSGMKNDFVSNMTHELKTPISTISLASQMLGDSNIPDEKKDITRISSIISQESKRLGYQVERVLQSAVFTQGKLKLKLKKFDFHEIIENSIENFTIQVESKGGILVPSLHAEHSDVMIDKVHLTNVLSNLLDNALKYCDKAPEIFVETRNIPGKFIFSVRDNGMGISKADQKRIFDRFFRVTTGNVHNIKGFGLGLSYVRKVIEEHNGAILIDSEIGQGTVFTIELPLAGHN